MRFVINGFEVFDLPLPVFAMLGAGLTLLILWAVGPPLIKGGHNEKPDGPRPPDPVGQGTVGYDLCKLLDNGYTVSIFRNGIGSYTAVAHHDESFFEDFVEGLGESHITDDFTPDKAFYRLVEKVTTGRIV